MSPGQLRHEARRQSRKEKREEDEDESGDNDDAEPDPEPVSELQVTHRRDGRERITADLTPADAAHLLAALDRQAERYGKDPDTKQWALLAQRRARALALVDLATAAEPSDRGDRATAVVHIDWHTLAGLADTGSYVDLPFAAGLAGSPARSSIRPDGTILGTTRPPLPPDIRERMGR